MLIVLPLPPLPPLPLLLSPLPSELSVLDSSEVPSLLSCVRAFVPGLSEDEDEPSEVFRLDIVVWIF